MEVQKPLDDDIMFLLQGQLDNCSRQRLRALETSLNIHSNNEYRITPKDMQIALQENDIHLSERTIKELCDYYSDNGGVNFKAVHQCLQESQSRTGRDSVIAMKKRLTRKQRPKEEQMEDLIQRLRKILQGENSATIDLDKIEKDLAEKDQEKISLLPKEELLFFLNDLDLPIYGALLDALVSNLPDTKNSHLIRWRQVLNVIGMIQKNADTSHVMAILAPVEKGKIYNNRHLRMVSGSKHRPTNDLNSGSKSQPTHQILHGKPQPDFILSTRILNQSAKRDFHGMDLVRKHAIPIAPQNPPQTTGTTIDAGKGQQQGEKNESLITNPQTVSSETTNPTDALPIPNSACNDQDNKKDSASNVQEDKKVSESTKISISLQQMALTVTEKVVIPKVPKEGE